MTKRIVGKRLPRVHAPVHLAEQIRAGIRSNLNTTPAANRSRLDWLFRPVWKPVTIAAALAVVVFLILSGPNKSHNVYASTDNRDVFHQVFTNFDGILDGAIKPDIESNDPGVVEAFFFPKANFSPSVSNLDDCRLIGGMFSTFKEQHIAHIVYEHDGEILYVVQTNLRCMLDGRNLSLPMDVRTAIQSTGHFEREFTPSCSIIAWTRDSVFFCAVADIPKADLISCVSSIRE